MTKGPHSPRRVPWTSVDQQEQEHNSAMPTPMSTYAEIAARYHIDPSDEEAVTRFFRDTAPGLPADERVQIFNELLGAHENEERSSTLRQQYTTGTPDARPDPPTLAAVPSRPFNPHRDGNELDTIARSITRWIDHYFRLSGLNVATDVRTSDAGHLVVRFGGPDASRLESDQKHLLKSMRNLLSHVADAQPVLDMIEIGIASRDDEHRSADFSGKKQLVGGDDQSPRVVSMDHIAVRAMSVDDAARTLKGSPDEFIVFRDADSDKVRVIYKRSDRNLGLISPE